MLRISPKLIDVEGNRVGYVDDKDFRHIKNSYTHFIDMYKETNNISMNALVGVKDENINVVNENGRFPTQLFTNIKNNQFKYVKNIT